jgi:polar amino acid transport system substrate-binding protein
VKKFLFIFFLLFAFIILNTKNSFSDKNTLQKIKERGYILWGTDLEGGAPYAFPDPVDTNKVIGFEIDLAEAIAKELGVKVRYVQNAWDSLIPSLERGDYDVAVNGIEITDERKKRVLFSIPYYVYSEQLVVRKDDNRINGLEDLKGKKVGTLQGAVAQEILESIGGVIVKNYSGVVEPYEDLALGRLDAVFLDYPIAAYYAKPNPKLKFVGPLIAEGFYGIAIRKEDKELKEEIDKILIKLIETGELKKIYEKWNLWNEKQEKLKDYKNYISGEKIVEDVRQTPIYTFLPNLFKGALITIGLSVSSMILAIFLGLLLCLGKIYGSKPIRTFCASYIEFFRGTPLLIQLYIIYYGLPNIGITLNPLTAAIIGLGLNYASYEAELYRAGIMAIPKGQMEAALSLGMTKKLALRRIILPQAIKIAIPGVTNDFIALFKDTSLVSVIAMVELTKTYTIIAANTLRYFELGIIVAILYFGMSYPLSILAKRLEEKLSPIHLRGGGHI